MTRDELIQAKKRGDVPMLQDVADLNLCDLGIAINYGATMIKAHNADGTCRRIDVANPCLISAHLTRFQYERLMPVLQRYRHQVVYLPPGYFRHQRQPLYELTLDCGYNEWNLDVRLLDFGHSYGTVSVNGIECAISHSGGTGSGDYSWIDTATGWNLVGAAAFRVMKAILSTGTRGTV